MGIVNLTGDSYFAQSRCSGADGLPDPEKSLGRIGRMFEEGADIVDIGACSTRPGAALISEEEEWERLAPVLTRLRRHFPSQKFSIDTFRTSIVRKSFGLIGDFTVNDISAGEDDPDMLRTVGSLGLDFIAMHKRGTPETMQGLCSYRDVTEDVLAYFRDFAKKAGDAGIRSWTVDPGFGFAKTVEQNYRLLKDLHRFSVFGRPVLVGVSRKSMIYRKFGITPEESLPQTQVLHLAALQGGATILRVHDVAEAVRTVAVFRLLS